MRFDGVRRAMPQSPRIRLTLGTAVVIALVLTVAGLGALAALQRSLLSAIDADARDDAIDVAAQIPAHAPRSVVEPPTPDAAVQIVRPGGEVVAASAGAPSVPLLPAPRDAGATVRATGPLPIRNGADSYRVATRSDPDSGLVVYVALPSDDVADAVRGLRAVIEVGAPALFGVLVVLAWFVAGRALVPVNQSIRRQREFVADAAHELRTPLAAMRTQLEVAVDEDDRDLRQRLPELLHEVDRLTDVVEAMLTLARTSDSRLTVGDVDLDDVVRAAVGRMQQGSRVVVDASAVSAVRVRGDAATLSRLVDNLLDNAVRHASSRVVVALAARGRDAVLTVDDDGPGIPPADRERVFDRFARLDPARTRWGGGFGLGLPIARAVARAHRGDIRIGETCPGACFVVTLPMA